MHTIEVKHGGFERAKAQRVARIEYIPRELSDPEPRLPL